MDHKIKSDALVEPFIKNDATKTAKGSSHDEILSVRILHAHGILFSAKKGKARRETPIPYLLRGNPVPGELKHLVLTRGVDPGLKLWRRIDRLVNMYGYILLDERRY
ncbi:MAG: hypothetical protein AAF696_22035 [Bacteroidota bacterium]